MSGIQTSTAPATYRGPEAAPLVEDLVDLESYNNQSFDHAEELALPFDEFITPWAVIQAPKKPRDVFRVGRVWVNTENHTAHAETLALIDGFNSPEEIQETGELTTDPRNLVTPDQTHTFTFSADQLAAMHPKGFVSFIRKKSEPEQIAKRTAQVLSFERDAHSVEAALDLAGHLKSSSEAA